MRAQYWPFFTLAGIAVVAVACLIAILAGPPASAQPIAGGYYSGQVTGCAAPPCGTVDFTVSGDGLQVQGFTAYDVPGEPLYKCQFMGSNPFPTPLAIVDDSFGPGIEGMYEVSGSFPSEGSAEGSLRLVMDDPKPCDSGVLDWTATT